MTQNEFDRILMDEAGSLPPQDFIVAAASPWRSPMEKIMWGMALNSFTLGFFYLQYILPLLGSVLMYLGYRSLRRENGWFKLCWLLSGLSLGWHALFSVLAATPLNTAISDSALNVPLIVLQTALYFSLLFSLRLGIRASFAANGESKPKDWLGRGILAELGCYAIALWCTLVPLTETDMLFSFFGPQIMDEWEWLYYGRTIAAFALKVTLLVCIGKQTGALTGRGYAIAPAPVKYSARIVLIGVFAAVALALPPAMYWGSHVPMPEAEVFTPSLTAEQEMTRRRLIELGLPEELATMLDETELDHCRDAYAILPCLAYDGDLTDEDTVELRGNAMVTELDGTEVELSSYMILLPEYRSRRLFFFVYREDYSLHLQEQLSVDPIGNYPTTNYAGRLFWEQDGQTHTLIPEIRRTGGQTADQLSPDAQWWYENELKRLGHLHYCPYFNFTTPRSAQNVRGYLAYTLDNSIDPTPDELYEWSIVFLRRQVALWQYPFVDINNWGGSRSNPTEGSIHSIYAQVMYSGDRP